MRITAFLKPLSFLPAIALMYMIYSFSGEDAETSSGLSYKLSRKIVQTVNRISDQNWEDWQMDQKAGKLEFYVRKFAHMSEYFLLAVAVSFPLYVYGIRGLFLMILAFLICIAYAAGDEYHQTFISGRDGSVRDVYGGRCCGKPWRRSRCCSGAGGCSVPRRGAWSHLPE